MPTIVTQVVSNESKGLLHTGLCSWNIGARTRIVLVNGGTRGPPSHELPGLEACEISPAKHEFLLGKLRRAWASHIAVTARWAVQEPSKSHGCSDRTGSTKLHRLAVCLPPVPLFSEEGRPDKLQGFLEHHPNFYTEMTPQPPWHFMNFPRPCDIYHGDWGDSSSTTEVVISLSLKLNLPRHTHPLSLYLPIQGWKLYTQSMLCSGGQWPPKWR